MSFSMWEILEEFVEASRLGRRANEPDFISAAIDRRWWNEVGFKTLRPSLPPIVRVAIQSFACPQCGAPCERREGTNQNVHLGRFTRCRRRAA